MKRVISLALVVVLCLSLCACGGAVKLTEEKVKNALADCEGALSMEKAGKKVVSFTYVVKDINADDLMDRQYTYKAISLLASGNTGKMTFGHFKVLNAVLPLLQIDVLLGGNKKIEYVDVMVDKVLGIICDGKTENYGGWTVSAVVDQDADSITIKVVS